MCTCPHFPVTLYVSRIAGSFEGDFHALDRHRRAAAGGGDNLDRICAEVALVKARLPWVDMVVVGELAMFSLSRQGQAPAGPAEARMCAAAKAAGVWLIPGTLYEKAKRGDLQHLPGHRPERQGRGALSQDLSVLSLRGRHRERR